MWHGLVDPATNRASGYTYDANGNATSPSLQNAFDIENRIVSQTAWVQSSQYMYNYGYDPDNRRVYKATSSYDPGSGGYTLTGEEVTFWSPTGQRMGTYTLLVDPGGNGYGPTLSFRWTNSERVYFGNRLMWRGGAAVYTDRLGSVGKYFPYGEERPSATVGDGEKFATYYRDGATGLDYAVNRYYDSGTGRVLTPDPYRASVATADPQSWNRYSYTGGDPVNYFDPTGLERLFPMSYDGPDGYTGNGYPDQQWYASGGMLSCQEGPGGIVCSQLLLPISIQSGSWGGGGAPLPDPCITPQHPSTADIKQNISEVKSRQDWVLLAGLLGPAAHAIAETEFVVWLYDQVRNKGAWDYKQQGPQYQDFGNFNYGAVTAAAGLPLEFALRMAGWAQIQAGTSKPEWGSPVGGPPYGDDPADQEQIRRGYAYYGSVAKGDCP